LDLWLAIIRFSCSDGSTEEYYYRDGVELRENHYYAEANPLPATLRLPPANGGQDAIDALLREAMAEQSARLVAGSQRSKMLSEKSDQALLRIGSSTRLVSPEWRR